MVGYKYMPNINQEKLKLWKKQEEDLNKQLADALKKRGAAAQEGDLSENADYKMYSEKAEMISARIGMIQKMIRELEKGI